MHVSQRQLPSVLRLGVISATLFAFSLTVLVMVIAAPGDLDTTFGDGGIVITQIENYNGGSQIIPTRDGAYLVVGTASSQDVRTPFPDEAGLHYILVRYLSDGTLDTSFGADGIVQFGTTLISQRVHVAELADGKLLVATAELPTRGPNWRFILARFNADGTPDTTFDDDGFMYPDFSTGMDVPNGLVLQSDEKFVLLIDHPVVEGQVHPPFDLARFNPDGTLDTTFGTTGTGIVTAPVDDWPILPTLVIDGQDRLTVEFSQNDDEKMDCMLMRFTAHGEIDRGFGVRANGTSILDAGEVDVCWGILSQPDGKLIVNGYTKFGVGQEYPEMGLFARFTPGGVLDTTFGSGGIIQMGFGMLPDIASILTDADGRLILVGTAHSENQSKLMIIRLLSDGTIDTAFGTNGLLTIDFDQGQVRANAALLVAPNKILILSNLDKGEAEAYRAVIMLVQCEL